MKRRFPTIGVSVFFTNGFILCLVHLTCISDLFVYSCSQPFPLSYCLLARWLTASLHRRLLNGILTTTSGTKCVILCRECFFPDQIDSIFASYLLEIDLAKIALSYLYYWVTTFTKGGACFSTMLYWAQMPIEFFVFLWHHCQPGANFFLLCLVRRYKLRFFGASLQITVWHVSFPLAGAFYSRMVKFPYVALVDMDLSLREERQLKTLERCAVVTTAILRERGSCH